VRYKAPKVLIFLIILFICLFHANASGQEVINPKGGDTWIKGSTCEITWSGFSGETVSITLYRGTLRQLSFNVSNTGSYSYTVPDIMSGDNYNIVVISADQRQMAKSEDFSIISASEAGNQKVTSPTSKDTLMKGKEFEITWSGFTGSAVKIRLVKGNTSQGTIIESTPNDGSYSWIPTTPGTGYQVSIVDNSPHSLYASSETFNVIEPPTVFMPKKGDKFNKGDTFDIRWYGFSSSQVTIKLCQGSPSMTPGSATEIFTIERRVPNSGRDQVNRIRWTVPKRQASSSDYLILVQSTTPPSEYDFSENFSIIGPLKITSPSRGDSWRGGSKRNITWDGFTCFDVKIELYRDTAFLRTITRSTRNDGSYSWRLSNNYSGSNFRIKVSAISGPLPHRSIESEFFTIELAQVVGIRKDTTIKPAPVIGIKGETVSTVKQLKVTNPRSSDVLYPGSTCKITWVQLKAKYVKIELYKGSVLKATIAGSTLNRGYYKWKVHSGFYGSKFRIVVISTSDSSQKIVSGYFSIKSKALIKK